MMKIVALVGLKLRIKVLQNYGKDVAEDNVYCHLC